jgi:4-diphosphocytidyl-2-C-methyl-D-erythritol kinase
MSRPSLVRALAPAKINLWLEVLGRRRDGYHEIRSWMLALELCDRLEARASSSGAVALSLAGTQASADVPAGAANLACRAAAAALAEGRKLGLIGERDGVDLALEKQIPSRAGLGGGSADAAAAWIAACAALGFDLPAGSAEAALSALGSDCDFFARARETGCARCAGRGEVVVASPAPRCPWNVAVLTPPVACWTAEVYAALDPGSSARTPAREMPAEWSEMPASAVRPFLFNRLEAAAMKAFPTLCEWRKLLDRCDAEHWRLSGSGSSFFGLYDRPEEVEGALERIRGATRGTGLPIRGLWATRPSAHGASLVEVG